MYKGKKIAVVVPAYNEERFIAGVLTTIPPFVDKIYAVNDASVDRTLEIAQSIAKRNGNITVIDREKRGGIGAAVTTGHKKALADGMYVIAVMAGDGQMDPSILHEILDPVVEGRADYAKGDRLSIPQYRNGMSTWRVLGNFLLTHLTRISSGYRDISDPENGYTAISTEVLRRLVDGIEKGFAFENNLLVKLHVIGARVVDVPHPALYQGQYSKIRYPRFIVTTSRLLLKYFLWRLYREHIKRPFDRASRKVEHA